MSRARPQLTGRAAVLAVVVCAIAMSLAYPVREYIAQRRNVAELEQQKAKLLAEIKALDDENRQLSDPAYRKRVARERLFYCEPGQKCYVVMDDKPAQDKDAAQEKQVVARPPWYQTLWESVEAVDKGKGRKASGG
ncbi:septum formation initiator family protein [Planomonospora sp. ID67723]|uniref:FtsB family cell division protein n=1 Tax=Planomonospora sp. ID67723 TaxID=2738134 RepID=UPI0018C3B107|nr:septum formation initiator family protein [Planomonospora sp. ID67723]MBG0826279.1 septum formation initiator family protein [Planomonospora sp. ID67723]